MVGKFDVLVGLDACFKEVGLSGLVGFGPLQVPVSYTHLTLPTIYSV